MQCDALQWSRYTLQQLLHDHHDLASAADAETFYMYRQSAKDEVQCDMGHHILCTNLLHSRGKTLCS